MRNKSRGSASKTGPGEGTSGTSGNIVAGNIADSGPDPVYKNLRRPLGDKDPDMRRSGRYEEIMIQRKIRGQHESVNNGPGV